MNAPGVAAPGAIRFARRWLLPVLRVLFRPRLHGWANLPERGPYLLVSNHNAGLGLAELSSFVALWAERFGTERRLAGFAHVAGFDLPPLRKLHEALGSIPSTYEAAFAALEDGSPILVFPGGDHETMRPIWQAHRVDFGGRTGFLKIARQARVPIVPMGIRGSHFTAPMLLRADWLAWALVLPRLLGLKRYGLSLLAVLCCVALAFTSWPLWLKILLGWVAVTGPQAFLPWIPWTIRFRVGEPIPPDDLFDGDLNAGLDGALARVEATIQALVEKG